MFGSDQVASSANFSFSFLSIFLFLFRLPISPALSGADFHPILWWSSYVVAWANFFSNHPTDPFTNL